MAAMPAPVSDWTTSGSFSRALAKSKGLSFHWERRNRNRNTGRNVQDATW